MVVAAKTIQDALGADGRDSALKDLLELARDKSVPSRNQLVERLGDLYFERSSVDSAERDMMGEILRDLVRDVEMAVRTRLSRRLAADPDAPAGLISALANDEIEVAHPILVQSNALGDAELIEIIHRRTMRHRESIAERRALSEEVSDALAGKGEVTVIETLLCNHGAEISNETMTALVEASKDVVSYQGPLLDRSDLTPHLARRMYWWVSAALREHIANNFEIDSTELDTKIVSTVTEILGERPVLEMPADGLDELARKLSEVSSITPELLIETLREREMSLFEALLARLIGLKKPLVRRFILEPGGEALSIACKSANITKADFTSIFLLSRSARPGEKVVDPNELSRAMAFYDRLTPGMAKKVVERWHLDPDYLDALKRVHARDRRATP
jgi:uncharacterized protein (DUF2336 family)